MAENGTENPLTTSGAAKAGAVSGHAATLKLRPVIRPAGSAPAAAPAAPAAAAEPNPMDALKSVTQSLKNVTQNLKGVTAPIPQQAILHKTGMLADPGLSEAQRQASKARTSRISLSEAVGAAPVKSEGAPMKTIRIKRPTEIGAVPAPAAAPAAAPDAEPPSTMTQRKTLKIQRPTSKATIKKPAAAPAAAAEKPAEGAEGEVADIPEMPSVSAAPMAVEADSRYVKDVPKALAVFDFLLQLAACAAVGFLGYMLYIDTTLSPFENLVQ